MMDHGLDNDTIQMIQQLFSKYEKVHQAILYGSRAKGTHTAGSDIDLALKGKDLSIKDVLQLRVDLDELNLPFTIDLTLYDETQNQDLLDHIDRVGTLLYIKPSHGDVSCGSKTTL